ncbi:LAFA_0C07536g1_1 [Lachancea sp. 'fantastica']|nr:LAFA_0C07536g1_1 [Lachancea sp. 'fantastica']
MDVLKLTGVFATIKCIQCLIALLAPNIQFDTSTALFLKKFASQEDINNWWNARFWNKLVGWDAVYFLKNAMQPNSQPEYEHENAFSPLWSQMVREACHGDLSFYHVLKTGVLLENSIHLGSAILLYFLTLKTFKTNTLGTRERRHLAFKSAVLFIAGSGSGFFLGLYSEPLSAFLTFLGLLSREISVKYDLHGNLVVPWYKWPVYTLLSATCFTAAFAVRPNCILLGLFYIFDLYKLLVSRNYGKALFMPFLSGLSMFSFFIYYHYYAPYQTYCPSRGAWCSKKILNLPLSYQSIYNFIQGQYWNNGFLRYWTLNNVPNFIIGLPNVITLWFSAIYFSHQYPCSNLKPLVLITRLLLIILVLFAHIQIINRVSSFIPLHLWYIAHRHNRLNSMKGKNIKGDDRLVRLYVIWIIFWLPLQTALFASFLPPA